MEGGCSNDYAYVADPINQFDLDGRTCAKGFHAAARIAGYGDFGRAGAHIILGEYGQAVKDVAGEYTTYGPPILKRIPGLKRIGRVAGKFFNPFVGSGATLADLFCEVTVNVQIKTKRDLGGTATAGTTVQGAQNGFYNPGVPE